MTELTARWFTRSASIEACNDGELRMRWTGAREARQRETLWGPEHAESEIPCDSA